MLTDVGQEKDVLICRRDIQTPEYPGLPRQSRNIKFLLSFLRRRNAASASGIAYAHKCKRLCYIRRAASTAAENVSRRILPIANLLAGGHGDGQASADARCEQCPHHVV